MYMSLRALKIVSWPPWRETQLPHTYSKLSLWKEEYPSNKHNKQRFIALLSQRLEQAGARSTRQEETPTPHCANGINISIYAKNVLVRDDIDLLVLLIYHAKNVSITSSSDQKLDGRVRREIDAGTSLQCEPFLEVLSLTTLCSCMPFMGVISRPAFTVWSRNYKSQRSNLTISSKIMQRFS